MRQFINFIKHKNRISRTAAFQILHDSARHCSNVSPAVTTDFRLIPDAAERNPDKFPVHCSGNGSSDRGFSHARWSDQTEDRRPATGIALTFLHHSQKLQYPHFYVFQTEVVRLQYFFCCCTIQSIGTENLPRHIQQPGNIVVTDVIFRGVLGNKFQPVKFFAHDSFNFFRQRCLFQFFSQFGHIGIAADFSQFMPDDFQLLPQIKFPLTGTH